MVKKNKEYMSFYEDGKRYMQCKHCRSEYVRTSEGVVATTCSKCVTRITTGLMTIEDFYPSWKKQKKTGRPAGWHWMNEFVDKDGNVFHRGKEQPKLKGTLKPTVVKPPKKRKKRRTKEQMLLAIDAERKSELKKAVQKQKDFLNHNIDKG